MTSWNIVAQLVEKFPSFYVTRNFNTVFKEPYTGPYLSQLNPVHILISCFFKIHFNIIFHFILGLRYL